MKHFLFIFFLFSALTSGAQTITFDTIRVSPNDERNIHRNNRPNSNVRKANQSLQRNSVYETRERKAPVIDKSKLRFGADLGLSISNNYTNLGLGPQIGYQFNNHLMIGAGIKYYYTRSRTYDYEIRNNLLGVNVFGYLYPVNFIALLAQPELNYTRSKFKSRATDETFIDKGLAPSFVVGAGFRLGRSHVTVNYDLVQHADSPHPDGFYLGVSAFF